MVVDAIKAAVVGRPWSPGGSLAVVAVSFAVAALVIAIQFPFFFRLGYLRARFLTFVTIAVVGAVIAGLVVQAGNSGASSAWLEAIARIPAAGFTAGGLLLGFGFLAASAAPLPSGSIRGRTYRSRRPCQVAWRHGDRRDRTRGRGQDHPVDQPRPGCTSPPTAGPSSIW